MIGPQCTNPPSLITPPRLPNLLIPLEPPHIDIAPRQPQILLPERVNLAKPLASRIRHTWRCVPNAAVVELRLKREAAEARHAVGGREARGGKDEGTKRFSSAGPAVQGPGPAVVVEVAEAVVGVVGDVRGRGCDGAVEVGCAVGGAGGEGDGEAL